MVTFLEFEKPVAELEARIKELKASAPEGGVDIGPEVEKLEAKAAKLLRDPNFKRSLCRAYGASEKGELCRFGAACKWAHGVEDLRSHDNAVPVVVGGESSEKSLPSAREGGSGSARSGTSLAPVPSGSMHAEPP